MMDMGDMMNRCVDAMGLMMGGGMMGSGFLLVILIALLLVWSVGLVTIGALGFWAVKKLSGAPRQGS